MYTRALTTMESYYLLELPPDSDIWQVSYTRARRSFSLINIKRQLRIILKEDI